MDSREQIINDSQDAYNSSLSFQQDTARPVQAVPAQDMPEELKKRFLDAYRKIMTELDKVVVGQDELKLVSLIALIAGGHILVESVSGLGKTLFASALGRAINCRFGRIQFTPDLMPSDVVGMKIYDLKTQEFQFHPGPIFTQILLVDEINRSPAKTHAALLESMQESSATIDGETFALPQPFFTIATQNPIESEGTYRLPEAQLDRFMFVLTIDYPSEEQELKVLMELGETGSVKNRLTSIQPVLSAEEILELRSLANTVRIAPQLFEYVNKIVRATRTDSRLSYGASTRAGLALVQGARVLAAFQGRGFATPDDVVKLALPALRRRVYLTPEAEIEGRSVDQVLSAIVRSVETPRL